MSTTALAPTLAGSASPTPTSLVAGGLFADRYEILSKLGEGGMGAVYRVLDRELGEEIALKVLRPEIAAAEGALERFRREVKLARRVTHENVARTYDLGVHQGMRFLTMELIAGESLARRGGRGQRMALADVLRIAADVTRGLAAAHAAGVVHRDLKPDNVLIAPGTGGLGSERVVVTDFGIARLEAAPSHDTVGVALGTPAYMAPEQVEGRALDGRADVYALGVVIYELLTGELPFDGASPWAIAAARLSSDVPDPRAKVALLGSDVVELLRAATQRKREARLDARLMLERIEAIRGVGPSPIAGGAAAPSEAIPMPRTGPRTLALVPLSPTTSEVSQSLSSAIVEALSSETGVRVPSPGSVSSAAAAYSRDGVLDAPALGRALDAHLVIDGEARVSAGRVRARMRMTDVASGLTVWSRHVDGSSDDPFALEDRVVAEVREAVRAQRDDGLGGPADLGARTLYRRAREAYLQFTTASVAEARKILEEASLAYPNDPWLQGALGAALVRAWIFSGDKTDPGQIARAEELALRALATDPTIGQTYATIGTIRLQYGELRAAVLAFREALARAPALAECHDYLGQLLVESGRTYDGFRHLELAARLSPTLSSALVDVARVRGLLGDWDGAHRACDEAYARGNRVSVSSMYLRLATWQGGEAPLERARRALAELSPEQRSIIDVRFALDIDPSSPREELLAKDKMRAVADGPHISRRVRTFSYQLSTEYRCRAGLVDDALESLERAAELLLIDLLWLDRCPLLDVLRADARFARARAITAARVAEMWT